MECIEARALKQSLLLETSMKSCQQVTFVDDMWCVAGFNNVPSDDFSVDDLLDFSDKDIKDGSFQDTLEEYDDKSSVSTASQYRNSNASSFSDDSNDFKSLSEAEFCVPVDDMDNLEWLSQFVDDSVSEFSLLCPAGSSKEKTGIYEQNQTKPFSRPDSEKAVPCFPSPVPVKARSKRSRPSGKVWSLALLHPSPDSSSTTCSSYGSSSFNSLKSTNPLQDIDSMSSVEKPPAKKLKRKPATETGSTFGGTQTLRRCTHCLVQKTPQWRTGPLGPKTLCNACGVRYKSGRLFPEYRPACSPTFSQEIHSNSHRKVLEMRRRKESAGDMEDGLALMVPTF